MILRKYHCTAMQICDPTLVIIFLLHVYLRGLKDNTAHVVIKFGICKIRHQQDSVPVEFGNHKTRKLFQNQC